MTGYKNDGANNSNRATTQLIKLHRPNTSDVCVCGVAACKRHEWPGAAVVLDIYTMCIVDGGITLHNLR